MTIKKLLTALIFSTCMMISTTVFATTIAIDGNFGLSEWNGYYASEDGVGPGGYLGPGYGGQKFDVEYLGLYVDGTGTVYFGLQTGFNIKNGVTHNNIHYGAGDLALDVNNNGSYDYAIRFDLSGSTPALTLYDVTTWQNVMYPQHAIADPYRYATGAAEPATFNAAYASGVFANNIDGGTSYVLEGSFDLSSLALYAGGPLALHWTMECGNDYLNTETSPVPEPGTISLICLGIVCCGTWRIIKRRRTLLG